MKGSLALRSYWLLPGRFGSPRTWTVLPRTVPKQEIVAMDATRHCDWSLADLQARFLQIRDGSKPTPASTSAMSSAGSSKPTS